MILLPATIWWNLYQVVVVGAWGAQEALLVRDREWKIKRKRNVLHWHWQKLSLWVCDKQKKRSTTTICLPNAPRCLYFPPHLIWPQKKVSRSPDIDNGRTMSMFCRPVNYSSFYQLVYLLSSFMSHTKTYHQENKTLAPLFFEFELQFISNLLLAPRPRLVVRPSLSCFYLLPLRTPAGLELFQKVLNTAHPNTSTHLALSASSFSWFCVCKVLVCVCDWQEQALARKIDFLLIFQPIRDLGHWGDLLENVGLHLIDGTPQSFLDCVHILCFQLGGRWPSFRRCFTRLLPSGWHSSAGYSTHSTEINWNQNVAISVCWVDASFQSEIF